MGKQISIAFLERVRADFKKRYGGGKADTAVAKSLNKEFGYVAQKNMYYHILLQVYSEGEPWSNW